jgi:UDP-N-acetylmuramoyl-tripeptide--D-alanyl-D-alanine ligase
VIATDLAGVAAATGGRLVGADPATPVTSVVIDSRAAGPGALFAALPGSHADGHDYAPAALAGGAAGVLAARPVPVAHVLVDDVVAGLSRLAAAQRELLVGTRVVAVTGSSGKTTTKDLLAAVLERGGECVSATGSFNNEIGTPLTMLRAGVATRFLVLEIGARGPGQVAALAAVARPHAGVVLNVGSAHVGEFGSPDAIAATKGELAEAASDYVVLNHDDTRVRAMADRARARVLMVSATGSPAADLRAERVEVGPDGRARFSVRWEGAAADVALQVLGAHQVANALAAAAVGVAEGLDLAVVADALGEAAPRSRWRLELTRTPGGVTVLNDAYNANPESMRAALDTLLALAGTSARPIAVLGEMRELGEESPAAHADLGRLVARSGVAVLVVVGAGARAIHDAANAERPGMSSWVPEARAAGELLGGVVSAGDVVLVKASRLAGLEQVAERLAGVSV